MNQVKHTRLEFLVHLGGVASTVTLLQSGTIAAGRDTNPMISAVIQRVTMDGGVDFAADHTSGRLWCVETDAKGLPMHKGAIENQRHKS